VEVADPSKVDRAMSKDLTAGLAHLTVVPSPEPDNRILVGMRIRGRYRVISELGTGAFGTVCLAEDRRTRQEIAIRFFPGKLADLSQPAQTKLRVDRSIVEASTVHPALVRVLEFAETENGQAFAAMELVQGRRLSEILSEGRLEIDTALRLAVDLGGAVEALHNMGLVHGALRPRNVMVGSDGRARLMDVELTGVRAAQAMKGIVADVPPAEYLSPEQIRQDPVTEATEIYAFAVMLYEMLCGTPPIQAETREAVLEKHLTETPVPMRRRRPAIPASVESIVALALSKVPEPRPPMQTILNRLWEEANRPAKRWRRMDVIIAGGALAATIAVVAGWSVNTLGPAAPPPLVLPTLPPVGVAAPIPASPTSSASPIRTRTEPAPEKATPAVVPSSTARSAPPSAPAPPPASPPRRAERQEQRSVQQTPESLTSERPSASDNQGDPDPSAIIDWILEQRAPAKRGQ
jgi:eukaryotic-like serine/threonine-protein kinase